MATEIIARPYQKECVEVIDKTPTGRHIVSLATGLGKTVIMSMIKRNGRMLILSHRDELVYQPQRYFKDCTFGVEKANIHANGEDVVSASVQTLAKDKRLKEFSPDEFQTIIVDEAHHAAAPTYKKILDHFSGAQKVIGLTATPKRGDNVRLDNVFDDIIYAKDLKWGIENNYLSRVRCMEVVGGYTLKGIRKQTGDYSNTDVERRITEKVLSVAAKAYVEVCDKNNRHTLIYCVTVQKCLQMQAILRKMLPEEKKDRIQVITGKTSQEDRSKILDDFSNGDIDAIINCMVLTEGTDLPICDTILNIRPTCNGTLYQQMVGRGTRLHEGKDYCLVLDIIPNEDGSDRTLCTAPSLFGVDAEFLSKRQKKRLTPDTDLLAFCDEITGETLEFTKKLALTLREVDTFVQERDTIIKKVASAPSATFRDLCNGLKMLNDSYEGEEETEYDFGDMQYEIQPSESKRYLIHADWTNIITISKPDIMGNVTIDFLVNNEHYIGELSMEQAIQMAQDYCYTVPKYMWYSWSKSLQKIWANEMSTDAQQKKLYMSYLSDGAFYGARTISKLEASNLIEMKTKLDEQKNFLKKYQPSPKSTAATVKKKNDELAEWLEKDDEKRSVGRKKFSDFRKNVIARAKVIKDQIAAEQKELKSLKAQINEKGNYILCINISSINSSAIHASDKQIAYAKMLIQKTNINRIFIQTNEGRFMDESDFGEDMNRGEVSMYIGLLKYITDNVDQIPENVYVENQSIKRALTNLSQLQGNIKCAFILKAVKTN